MSRDENYTPFTGRAVHVPPPMRVLHRFTKPGHVAEIRERSVTTFGAIEYLVFIDDSLTESQLFHGARLERYRPELEARIAQFTDGGWAKESVEARPQ